MITLQLCELLCNLLFPLLCLFHNTCLLFSAPCGFANVDIVFAFDSSTTVTRENFLLMIEFAKDMVEDTEVDNGSVRVGALLYSSVAQVQFDLHSYSTKRGILDAFDRLPYMPGRTNTAEALRKIRTKMFKTRKGDRGEVENVVVIVTGSMSDRNTKKTITEARKLRSKKVHIYAVGVGLTDTRELEGISSPPAAANSFALRSFSELFMLPKRIVADRCKGSEHTV